MNYDKVVPSGKAVSKAQYHFYEQVLNSIPHGSPRRKIFLDALDVDYASLPERASLAPKAPPQALPKALPRIEGIKVGNRTVCYLVRKPQPVFFIANAEVWSKIHEAMPEVTRSQCMTLKEARSFMELEGVKVKSLKEAATLWASDCPAEAVPLQPQPKADKPWVDDENPFANYGDGDDDDDNEAFN